ncbi:MAG TPA: DUF4157 domain-containing protein [Candidatus Elarobacter sp.]|nr:DUF4157 domain-containing protein [Candidatus Elarobacter sp.]
MPAHVQDAIEHSFGVTLGAIRVHSDPRARDAAEALSARAFAHGPDVVLGGGERTDDMALMAHEAAHVVQQRGAATVQAFSPHGDDRFEAEANRAAAAVLRGERFTVQERVESPRIQRSILSRALHWFNDHVVDYIPAWRMFTIVLGWNPITGDSVDRSAANVMRAIVEFLPGGKLITDALDNYGVFDKAGAWVDKQLDTLGNIGHELKDALYEFIDSLHLSDVFDLGGVWNRAKAIFSRPVDHAIDFIHGLYDDIIQFIKDALLKPLAELAAKTPAWDLVCAILGKNPITKEPVERSPDTLIGGFMKLIGEEEIWNNLKRANAVQRAWLWFQAALKGLLGFISEIPGLFLSALKSLKLSDILHPIDAFKRIIGIFGDFAGRFFTWAGNTIWNLLEIIFDVVAPGVLPYLKKAGAALKWIFKHPIEFVRNLVAAGKAGFLGFAHNIGEHLKAALLDWLTGSLTGIYVPKSFELGEVVKLLLSALGLTWQNIRTKLVRVVGESAVKTMETGFDIVVTLVKDGPAAAWEKIKDELTQLRDTVLHGIMDFVTTTIVKKAVEKIVSLLVPGGAFIQAIITIYDTVTFFIHKLAQIWQVVTSFLDSIMEIASGAIGGAAKRVEATLAGLLKLVINFLANFLGLGKISDKIVEIVGKVRDAVDKALDKLVAWIVNAAKKLFGKGDAKDDIKANPQAAAALEALDALNARYPDGADKEELDAAVAQIKGSHPVFKVLEIRQSEGGYEYFYQFNPTGTKPGPGSVIVKVKLHRPSGFWVSTKRDLKVAFPEQHNLRVKGERTIIKASEARRHIIPSQDVIDHNEAVLNAGITAAKAQQMINAKGIAGVTVDKPTRAEVQRAAMDLIRAFFNELSNLWVGNSRENSAIQDQRDFPPDWTQADIDQHEAAITAKYKL